MPLPPSSVRLLLAVLVVGTTACGSEPPAPEPASPSPERPSPAAAVEPLEVPAPEGVRAPELRADGDGALLSWLREDGDEHVLELVRWSPDGWDDVREVHRGADLFANWADRPGVVRAPDGALVAWWLAKLGEGTYAYGIHLARSEDDGRSWAPLGLLHPDDRSETEHGFPAFVEDPASEGLRAFWLDGRAMEDGGSMQLRTALVGPGGAGDGEMLDERVCECCAVTAARAQEHALAAYRDRSAEEVRDIAWVEELADGWSEPRTVADDGWTIQGCPVNGPALVDAADGSPQAVAWFTAAEGTSRVRVAVWGPEGAPGTAVDLDTGKPLGRIDAARSGDGRIWVSWLTAVDDGAEVLLQEIGPGVARGERLALGRTSGRRVAGVPRLEATDEGLLAVWLEDEESGLAALRAARIRVPST